MKIAKQSIQAIPEKFRKIILFFFNSHFKIKNLENGQLLVELLITIGLATILIPALLVGFAATRSGRAQQDQRLQATAYLKEAREAIRVVQLNGWQNIANGTYHATVSGSTWALALGPETINSNFTRQIDISDVFRDPNGNIATSGGAIDASTKKVVVSISWSNPLVTSMSSTMYLSHYGNTAYTETTTTQFNNGVLTNTQVTDDFGGEVKISNNNKAKWCSPAFSSATIDLPDGPPVAVAATASASITTPNDVYVATSPNVTNSIKLAYVNVTADTDPPVTTLRGKFTLDPAQYSNPSYVPSGLGLDNNFKTNDVKYYKSSGGKTYALLGTDLPDKEVIAILTNDGDPSNDETTSGEFQDPVNNIYKYWTYFNTRKYQGNVSSQPNQDQSPYGYGATTIATYGNRGYLASGGYLYVFDLSNIDTKSTSSAIDMVGCRIQLDGYECRPGSPGTAEKYNSSETGANWSDDTSPIHDDCSDGGNIELYATNDIYPVQVGGSTYIFVAVGGVTPPELGIVNVTNVPTSGTSPSISSNSCGRISVGNSGWRRVGSYDFNSNSRTEEAANSVYAKSDGTRAYISSNGGIDGDGNGQPDSKQFYVINTTNKSSPSFLSGSPGSGPSSGYYLGSGANGELYPRRSLTVLNGERVVLVGKDGISNGNDAQEYQVLDSSNEATLNYCSGLNFDQGFNDLTSVSEADTDNFVYMVANTTINELKIIQGGPDNAIYNSSGTFESQAFNAGSEVMSNRFFATADVPSQTSIQYQVAVQHAINGSCSGVTYYYVGPDGTSNTFYATSSALPRSSDGIEYENGGQCMRYKVYMTSADQLQTPTLYDFGINYSQ